jgi:DNA (cytosine-5)-methyltransferase 1
MIRKPRLLDLCCKAGGMSVGFARAGFEVEGVDIDAQPHYPFTFYQADALVFPLSGYDVIHVSPPCQGYSTISACRPGTQDKYERLIDAFRDRFQAAGKLYVIENVPAARRFMCQPILLCGEMFGLRTYRHRLFESNVSLVAPLHPRHVLPAAKTSKIPEYGQYWSIAGKFGGVQRAREAMGIDWEMTDKELANAIPPVYAEWIGRQLLQALGTRRQAVRIQLCACGCGQIARTPTGSGRPGRYATDGCRVRANRAKKAHVTKFVAAVTEIAG